MSDRARELLTAWADWRGSVVQVMRLRRTAQSPIGRWMKRAIKGYDIWEDAEPEVQYNDELMGIVDRIVAGMPDGGRDVIMLTYVKGRGMSRDAKAKRMSMTRPAFDRAMSRAHRYVDFHFPWSRLERWENIYDRS